MIFFKNLPRDRNVAALYVRRQYICCYYFVRNVRVKRYCNEIVLQEVSAMLRANTLVVPTAGSAVVVAVRSAA